MSLEFSDGTKVDITQPVKVGRDLRRGYIFALFEDGTKVQSTVRDFSISRIGEEGKDGTIHLAPLGGNQFKLSVPKNSTNGVNVEYLDGRKEAVLPGNSKILGEDASLVVGEKYLFSVGKDVSGVGQRQKNGRLYEFDKGQLGGLRRIVVAGDLHGDYNALNSLLSLVDTKRDGIIFLGDYADRGSNGVEVIDVVRGLIEKYPQNVVALKGNHEDFDNSGEPKFSPCDLMYEAEEKKGGWQRYFQGEFKPFVEKLYLAAMIPGEVLFVHGGVSNKIRSLSDLKNPTRDAEIDVLWSDPVSGYGERPNDRGSGVYFGEDISEKVCKALGVKRIIRSHYPQNAVSGPYYEHDGRVITTSCTNVYGGRPFVLLIDPANPSNISYRFL